MANQIESGIKSVRKEIDKVLDKLEKFIIEISKMAQPKPTKKTASKKGPAKKTAPAKKSTQAKKKPAPKKTVKKSESKETDNT